MIDFRTTLVDGTIFTEIDFTKKMRQKFQFEATIFAGENFSQQAITILQDYINFLSFSLIFQIGSIKSSLKSSIKFILATEKLYTYETENTVLCSMK